MSSFNHHTKAREFSFKFLYHLFFEEDVQCDDVEEELKLFLETYQEQDSDHLDNILTSETVNFAKKIIICAYQNHKSNLEKIEKLLLKNRQRRNKIESSIILMSLAENQSFPGTPKGVIINEAVELAKKFGTKDSSSFINAILDKIISSQKQRSDT